MTNRRFLWAFFAGLALLIGLIVGGFYFSESKRVTRARFEEVEMGMSWAQVIKTVGRQPGDYTSNGHLPRADGLRYWQYKSWVCDEGELLVCFDDEGKAIDVVVRDVFPFGPPTLVERLRRWLRL